MRVLVACEFSGVVRDAFLRRGHDAISCDILPTASPGPHHEGDLYQILYEDWDLIIAHPPCTALSVAGNRHYAGTEARREALRFVVDIWEAAAKVCIENPVGVISTQTSLGRPAQYIEPWMFGDPVQKKTGLWLRGLPPLVPDTTEKPEIPYKVFPSGKRMNMWYYETSCLPHDQRAAARSVTFKGIAKAMARQWG